MLNHGGSDITPFETFFMDPGADGYGVYAAVKYMAGLDYVDTDRIGLAGHSMGGNATNISICLLYTSGSRRRCRRRILKAH